MSKAIVTENEPSGKDLPETVHNSSQFETIVPSQALVPVEETINVINSASDIANVVCDDPDDRLDPQAEVNMTVKKALGVIVLFFKS